MRHNWTITIADYRGARHYTLSQLARRWAAGTAAVVGLLFLAGTVTVIALEHRVDTLHSELASLDSERARMQADNQSLKHEQQDLLATIRSRNNRLASLETGLNSLENVLGEQVDQDSVLEERLANATDAALQKSLILRSVPRGFPLAHQRISSRYGMRMHPIKNKWQMHGGIDLKASMNTPVQASADGIVTVAGRDNSGMGRLVVVRHNYGFDSYYGHLNKIDVEVGDFVRQGEVIGKSGNTGLSTGPHLHYEVRFIGERVDPEPFLGWDLEKYDTLFTSEEGVPWESLEKAINRTVNHLQPQSSPTVATFTAISP